MKKIVIPKGMFPEVNLIHNEITAQADLMFVVDESLIPPYSAGDVIMIHEQPDIFEGEIGAFLIDGKPHIKKRGKQYLFSVNNTVPPVPIDNNVTCIGKAIGILDHSWIVKK